MGLFSVQLNSGEEALTIVRRHWHTFSWSFLRFLIILAIAASLYYFLPPISWRFLLAVVVAFIAVIFLFYNLVVWYLVSIVITSERIIDINQIGLTKRAVTEISLADIARVSALKEGLFQNIFDIGTLVVEVKEGGKIVCFGIKHPEDLMSRINTLRRQKTESVNPIKEEEEDL